MSQEERSQTEGRNSELQFHRYPTYINNDKHLTTAKLLLHTSVPTILN